MLGGYPYHPDLGREINGLGDPAPKESSRFCSSLQYADMTRIFLFMFLSCFISIESVSTEYSLTIVICKVSCYMSGVAVGYIAIVALW